MKRIFLILVTVIAFALVSRTQTINTSWIDTYTGYYTVQVYVQTNDSPLTTPILVGEKKNILIYNTSFGSNEIDLEPVGIINDRHDYYRYVVFVFRQNNPSYNGYGYSIWLDSDEVFGTFNIFNIPIE